MEFKNKLMLFLKSQGIFIGIGIVFIYFCFTPGFLTISNLSNIPQQTAFVTLIAIGMTYVIISAGIDLSVGSIVATSAVILAILIENFNINITLATIIALCSGILIGAFNASSIVRFKVPPFISTLATMTIARGLARHISQNTKIFIHKDIQIYQGIAATGKIGTVPYIVIITFVVLILFWLILTKTQFGRYVFAVGGNEESARLSGINVGRVKLFVYMISGFLSSLVGIFMAFKFKNGNPEYGIMWELDAIAAVVVGGTSLFGGRGSVFRTFIGALFIGILDNGLLLMGLSSELIYIIKGLVILGAVLIDQIKIRTI